ncbi:hypothetical protein COCON_G00206740 [Conger conger]|uniref:RING-type domain-containing protein n=1 Tax=Conger conger TaxID=82655 RepID=A0A9Q1HPK5_CONCO|nr:hypothetical protein COCON_G00206740 [Conger conger]
MSTSVTLNLRTRVVSILDVLAKSAIAEISKVIDEGTEELRLEMSRSKKENTTLKRRLLLMEKHLQSARRHGKIRAIERDRIRTSVSDEIRKTDTSDSDSYEEEESLSTDSMFGKEWSINLWKDGELAAMKEEEAPLQPVINEEATQTVDDRPDLFSIKVELFEQKLEDTDPQEGLKISKEEESLSTDSMFGKEWSINLWKDGELAAMKEEEAPLQPVINEEATQTVDDRPDLFSIKVELFEQKLEDTDPQEGLKISSCFESESDSTERQYIKESYPQPAPTEIMEEPYARATSAGGRLEQDTLPITLEGTAESHASPAPPQSTAESGDAQPCFLREHDRRLTLFCLEDLRPVCPACPGSASHSGHRVYPLKEATHDCKVPSQNCLCSVCSALALAVAVIDMGLRLKQGDGMEAVSPSALEDDPSCGVCREVFDEPLVLSCVCCGCSFCSACLLRHWEQNGSQECPLCDRTSHTVCAEHDRRLTLFCLEDLRPVCPACPGSASHSGHRVYPLKEATHDCKVPSQNCPRSVCSALALGTVG